MLTGCSGDDGDRKRTEAAEWCKTTLQLDDYFDGRDGTRSPSAQIAYTVAADWIDVAPSEVRSATERLALIMRRYDLMPRAPADLRDARNEIAEYAGEYCPEPADCIADVDRNPRFPCLAG